MKSNYQSKKIKISIMIVLIVILLIGLIITTIYNNDLSNKEYTITEKYVKEESLSGKTIKTSLDLNNIFLSQTPGDYSFNINTYAVIKNNKIYYLFSPSYCNTTTNNNLKSICKEYKTNHESNIYLLSSNLDGNNTKKIGKIPRITDEYTRISYINKNNIFLENSSGIIKIDLKNKHQDTFKKSTYTIYNEIQPYPTSNDKELIIISYNNESYKDKMTIYNSESLKTIDSFSFIKKSSLAIDNY